jgi:uncharacterized SAM-binding protein YcdF (DUF218 family)
MFFALSKLLQFIITPIVWIIILFFFGLFSKIQSRKKKCLRWALIFTLFFTNIFLFCEFARLWEIPATRYENLKTYDVGIVLGGMSVYDEDMERPQFFRGVDRLIQAIELYKRGIIKKIIFTGGSGRLLHPEMKEGNYIKRYLLYLGVPQKDFLIESESKNTHESALLTKELIDKENIKGNFLMITSSFHMRRGLGCFNKAGINAKPYSTDRYAGPRVFLFESLFVPNSSALDDWTLLIHEMVGFVTYKIAGYL